MAEEGATAPKRCLIINTAGLTNLFILTLSWLQNLSQNICYFGKEVLLLYLQEMRGSTFILD